MCCDDKMNLGSDSLYVSITHEIETGQYTFDNRNGGGNVDISTIATIPVCEAIYSQVPHEQFLRACRQSNQSL